MDGWLTVSQAGRLLEVSPTMIRRWIASGRLKFVATPYGRAVDASSVAELAAERAARPRRGQRDDAADGDRAERPRAGGPEPGAGGDDAARD